MKLPYVIITWMVSWTQIILHKTCQLSQITLLNWAWHRDRTTATFSPLAKKQNNTMGKCHSKLIWLKFNSKILDMFVSMKGYFTYICEEFVEFYIVRPSSRIWHDLPRYFWSIILTFFTFNSFVFFLNRSTNCKDCALIFQ